MNIEVAKGLLLEAEFLASPNYDDRPDIDHITGIVVHNISLPPGEFGGGWINDFFLNQLDVSAHPYFRLIADLRVSTHLLIRRDGSLIQYVPFHKRAWHAGLSEWDGRQKCNDFTVGIELEGCDDQSFEQEQYKQLANTIKALCTAYPKLNKEAVKGHEHISPGRKTDPGPHFDWQYLFQLLT